MLDRTRTMGLLTMLTGVLFAGCAAILSSLETSVPPSSSTPTDGLREALRVATGRAVESLGRSDGYLGNELVRIEVPEKLRSIETALRTVGADDLVDEFVTSLNRSAEAAAPLARDVFVDSIREMTFSDAVAILRGERHEATDYFRVHAGPRIAELFRPIVDDRLESVGATRSFNQLADRAAGLPFVRRPVFDLTGYVTDEALDGLFATLAREEQRIREDPLARTTELLRKYFGDPAAY